MRVTSEDIDKAMQEVEASIKVALRSFIGKPVTDREMYNIRNTVIDILAPYYEKGILDDIPLVDVNHKTEIAAVTAAIADLLEMAQLPDADLNEIREVVSAFKTRLADLNEVIKRLPPNGIHVSLKDPQTYAPYIWPTRGKYDH